MIKNIVVHNNLKTIYIGGVSKILRLLSVCLFMFLCTNCICQITTNKLDRYDVKADNYDEPVNPQQPDVDEWNKLDNSLYLTWASRDEHYYMHKVPAVDNCKETIIRGWKGERINAKALVYSKLPQGDLKLRVTGWQLMDGSQIKNHELMDGPQLYNHELIDGTRQKNHELVGHRYNIPSHSETSSFASAKWIKYVITDDYRYCGTHDMNYQTWLVDDVIDNDSVCEVKAMQTRPIWISVDIPRDAEQGNYIMKVQLLNSKGFVKDELSLVVAVNSHTMPLPHDHKFHLDLWQQPYSISRYYNVERWSQAHIDALRPYLKALARAGQKVVSTILFYEPWGDQSYDKFSPMIQVVKGRDGKWRYDYHIFDLYVELCAECGIDKQINCYSMVPWDMTFRYFDEALGKDVDLKTTTDTKEYKELWMAYLQAFRQHLEQKGWFEKTCIAMDERAEKDMLNAYQIAHAVGFKMALAGNYHASLINKLEDFCVALNQVDKFTPEQLLYRKDKGMVTTFYTCCTEYQPNIFSSSLPAEGAFLPIYAAANDVDGYLHWSWINWDDHPLTDSRYRLFGSGDTYCYYPGNRSSSRFERLSEGIQQYEKIQILKQEYAQDSIKNTRLNELLSMFKSPDVDGVDCAAKVNDMEDFLNGKLNALDLSSRRDLFNTSQGGMDVPPYRIPGITKSKSGRLLASAARLVCGTDPGYGQVDVVLRTSDDNGKNWSDIITVAEGTGKTSAEKNYFDTAFGDPAIVADRTSNEVLILCVAGCTLYSSPNTTRQNPNLIALLRSHDNGDTWEQPLDVTESIYALFDDGHPIQSAFVGGGKIFQSRIIKKGKHYRLYAALTARPDGNRVIYSDDFGVTWKALGGANALPCPYGDEPKCEELPDGRVLISSRTSGGRYYNIFTYSNVKKGLGKWDNAVKSVYDGTGLVPGLNSTNGELLIVPVIRKHDSKRMHLALQTMPTQDTRSHVGIFFKVLLSKDNYSTSEAFSKDWDGFYQLSNTASAYSSLTMQDDGKIGVFFEETLTKWGTKPNPVTTSFPNGNGHHNYDGYDNIYLSIDIEEITNGVFTSL